MSSFTSSVFFSAVSSAETAAVSAESEESFFSSSSLITFGVQAPFNCFEHCPIRNPNTFVSPFLYCSTAVPLAERTSAITSFTFAISLTISIPFSFAISSGDFPEAIISRRIVLASFLETFSVSANSTSFAKASAVNGRFSIVTSPKFTRLKSSTITKFATLFGLLYAFTALS